MPEPATPVRNRFKELRHVPAHTVRDHPKNWRTHTEEQRTYFDGLLREIGIAGAILAYDDPELGLVAIDGHMRKEQTPDVVWPVLVLDVTPEEAETILATFDPIGWMAGSNVERLEALLRGMTVDDQATKDLLGLLADTHGIALKALATTGLTDLDLDDDDDDIGVFEDTRKQCAYCGKDLTNTKRLDGRKDKPEDVLTGSALRLPAAEDEDDG